MNNEKVNMSEHPVYSSPTVPIQMNAAPMNPQPPQYYQPQPQQVFIQQAPVLGPDPVGITCPNCRARIATEVADMTTMRTHSMALLLAILGCVCGCCLIPYCTKSFQAQKHTCPLCRSVIGIYRN
ncbi:hypothetical protein ACKWTF_003405 [Chironomus riparius]